MLENAKAKVVIPPLLLSIFIAITALATCAYCYEPIRGFDENRRKFYEHEAALAAINDNSHLPGKPQAIRIGFFDSHWHGLTVEDYISKARSMKCDVLIARGIPEPFQNTAHIVDLLTREGYGMGTVVKNPEASLGSGIIIGAAAPMMIKTTHAINYDDATVAYDVIIGPKSGAGAINIVFLTLSSFDPDLRLRQLAKVQAHISYLQEKGRAFAVVGSFHSSIKESSREFTTLNKPVGIVSSAFSVLKRAPPAYTSWHGEYTDTVLVSASLRSAIKGVQIVHTDIADALPIVFDVDSATFNLKSLKGRPSPVKTDNALNTAPTPTTNSPTAKSKASPQPTLPATETGAGRATPTKSFSTGKSSSTKSKSLTRAWNVSTLDWKLIFGVVALIFVVLVAFFAVRSYLKRSAHKHKGCIQATGRTFSDTDLKLASHTHPQEVSVEEYPCEKP